MRIFAVAQSQNPIFQSALCSEFDISEYVLYDLGSGFRGVLVPIPGTDFTAVICSRTGRILGGTIKHVKDEIKAHYSFESSLRIQRSLVIAQAATYVDINEFWPLTIKMIEANIANEKNK